jgi:hypothetical protein
MARLVHDAELLLAGPLGLGVGLEFWGEREFVLRREAGGGFVLGIAESRGVYASLHNEEQKQAILRQVVFDASEARLAVLRNFERLGAAAMPSPIIAVRYVWLDISWLQAALTEFEKHAVPLDGRYRESGAELHTVSIERPDRTKVEVRWQDAVSGEYGALSATWLRVWDQMSDALLNAETVEPEEHWPPNCPPEHRRVDALKLLLQEGPDGSPSAILDESQS